MKDIVLLNDNQLVANINSIAKYSGKNVKSLRDLITRHKKEFNELGLSITKEYDLKSQNKTNLNEEQTMFLLLLMRNSPVIKKFKLEVVKEFSKMKKQQNQLKLDFSETQLLDFENQLRSKENQLKESQKQIEKNKRQSYANSGDDKFCNVHRFVKDHNLNISDEEFNNILIEENVLGQKLINKYIPCPTGEYSKYDGSSIIININKMLEICTKRNIKEFDKIPSLFDS